MAVSLVGEVVNSCDAITGFNTGSISGDDDFVQGSGAIGVKNSASTLEMYTTSLGATAPYDFSSGGSEFGWHIILWGNSKSPINATAGYRIIVGNGTSRGQWNTVPAGFYKGGFVTMVVDTARAFDTIAAGSWTTGGNPAQLTAVSQMGLAHQTPASIMGSFNNFQIDQITIGLGVRVDAGTVGSPNTFETIRVADEGTNFWGWWSSKNGAYVGKGKLFIGPVSGSATCVFVSEGDKVTFADERVAQGFYEIKSRGAGTDVSFKLINISTANPANANTRWNLTPESDTNSFTDINGVWSGADQLTLQSNTTLTGTFLIDCSKLIQNGATINGVTVLDANTSDGTAFIDADDPSLISNCSFSFSDGHAIRITSPGTYTFSGNNFTGYGADGSNDAAIFNDSGGLVTLNVTGGGGTPTVRNGVGSSTAINSNVSVTVTPIVAGTEVRVFRVSDGVLLDGIENSIGSSFTFSVASGVAVDLWIFKPGYKDRLFEGISFNVDQNFNPVQEVDLNYGI